MMPAIDSFLATRSPRVLSILRTIVGLSVPAARDIEGI